MRSTCTKLLRISWYHWYDTRMCHYPCTIINCTHKVPFYIIVFMCHVVIPAQHIIHHMTPVPQRVALGHPHGAPCKRYVIATGKAPVPIKSTCTRMVLPAWLFTTICIHILEQGKKGEHSMPIRIQTVNVLRV